jgi:hypothetical protein
MRRRAASPRDERPLPSVGWQAACEAMTPSRVQRRETTPSPAVVQLQAVPVESGRWSSQKAARRRDEPLIRRRIVPDPDRTYDCLWRPIP